MKHPFKTLAIVAALGTAAIAAVAQPMGGHDEMMGQGRHGKMDPARMEAVMSKRADALKTQLKLTPEQQSAWNTYIAAMKPDAKSRPQHPSREELEKLTTPERIDKMRALRDQQHAAMQAAMDQRDQATKTFYNTLTAEQKKVFDSQHARMAGHERGRPGKDGAPHGPAKS